MNRQPSLLDNLFEEPPRPVTVSELTADVKRLLERRFGDVWVEGEISNFKRHTSGHWYFTLKDAGAQVRCASFKNANRSIRFRPEDGLVVTVRGRLSVYEPRGDYQLLVSSMEPVGLGALQLAFDQLKARLASEGLFGEERKRPIPQVPRRVGIVTSRTGAALQDILRVLRRRNAAISVLVAPARVQGEGAVAEIVSAISRLSESGLVDVMIVGRGGGSLEDLWAFNDERVARAIAASTVPVISAVGHETDVTIADFVADLRSPTPSAAAEVVAAASVELRAAIDRRRREAAAVVRYRLLDLRSDLRHVVASDALRDVPALVHRRMQAVDEASDEISRVAAARLSMSRSMLDAHARALAARDPRRRVLVERERLTKMKAAIPAFARRALDVRRHAFADVRGRLSTLDPLGVLSRGFAVVRTATGRIVRSPSDVAPGQGIDIRVEGGSFSAARTDDTHDGEGTVRK
ncbi:MAG: exodeoxyribonuclease VII large subunit [Blastocatellia bacterium]|nr:exodeoxyribonuclease VII large subunit [Blastocatellia bacterium]